MLDERASLKRWTRWLARAVPVMVVATFVVSGVTHEPSLLFLGLGVTALLGAVAGVLGWFAWPDSPLDLRSLIVKIVTLGVGAIFLAVFFWLYAFEHHFWS